MIKIAPKLHFLKNVNVSGVSKKTGAAYSFNTLHLLDEDQDPVEVRVPDDFDMNKVFALKAFQQVTVEMELSKNWQDLLELSLVDVSATK